MSFSIDNQGLLVGGSTAAPLAIAGAARLSRIAIALGLSALLHVALISIPAGNMEGKSSPVNLNFGELRHRLAPLTIQFGSQQLTTLGKQAEISARSRSIPKAVGADESPLIDNRIGESSTNDVENAGWLPEKKSAIGIPVAHYFQPEELNQRARIISDIDPNLGDLIDTPGTGKAILLLWINEDGAVDRSAFQSSTLAPSFEAAIQKQFGSARFQPAEIGRSTVKSLMKLEIELLPELSPTQSE